MIEGGVSVPLAMQNFVVLIVIFGFTTEMVDPWDGYGLLEIRLLEKEPTRNLGSHVTIGWKKIRALRQKCQYRGRLDDRATIFDRKCRDSRKTAELAKVRSVSVAFGKVQRHPLVPKVKLGQ